MEERKEELYIPETEEGHETPGESDGYDGSSMNMGNNALGENIQLLELLKEKATEYYRYSDTYRKKYKNRVGLCTVSTAVLHPIAILLLLPGSETTVGMVCHWLGMGTIVLIAIIYNVCRANGWKEKYKQRTATFLRLDDFLRRITFQPPKTEEQLQTYVTEYIEITRKDNEAGEANALLPGQYLEDNVKKAVKKLE